MHNINTNRYVDKNMLSNHNILSLRDQNILFTCMMIEVVAGQFSTLELINVNLSSLLYFCNMVFMSKTLSTNVISEISLLP